MCHPPLQRGSPMTQPRVEEAQVCSGCGSGSKKWHTQPLITGCCIRAFCPQCYVRHREGNRCMVGPMSQADVEDLAVREAVATK